MEKSIMFLCDEDLRLVLVQTIIGESQPMDSSAESIISEAEKLEAYIKGVKKDAAEDQA